MAYSKTEEYYQRVLNLIDANDILVSTDAKVKNCERIARLCTVLGKYKDCSELKEKYEKMAIDEQKKGLERDYQEYKQKFEAANSIDSYKRAELLLYQLGDYKDAAQMVTACRNRRLKMLAKQNFIKILKFIAVAAVVTGLVFLILKLNRNNPGQQDISVVNITKGIRISWEEQDNPGEYVLYKCAYNKKEKKWTDFTAIASINNGFTFLDENVYPGSNYRYAVIMKGKDDNGEMPSYYSQMIRIPSREIISLTSSDGASFTVRWSGSNLFTGYQVQYTNVKDSFAKAENIIIENKAVYSTTVKDLAPDMTYYVRVRSFHKVNGVIYYGGWSSTEGIALSSGE